MTSSAKSPKASQSTDLTASLSIIRANRNLAEFIRLRHVGSLRLFPQNATKPNKSSDLLQKEHTSQKYDVNSEGPHGITAGRVGRNMRLNVARNLVCVVNAASLRY